MTISLPRNYIAYPMVGPRMDKSTPPTHVQPGNFSHLCGADGRYLGCLHKFYGMTEVVDLVDKGFPIDSYSGPSFFRYVAFEQIGTPLVYRGFVVRWDGTGSLTDQRVDLFYTLNNGSNWYQHTIWAMGEGNGITNALEMDCATNEGYLFVCVKGKQPKTIYWNGSQLKTADMGPGAFSAALGALTLYGSPSKDSNHYLKGNGAYQVAWRFYDSKRGIYSALSNPITIKLDVTKTTAATGSISFNLSGSDDGKMVAGDTITINTRTYRYIDSGGDVTIPVASPDTTAGHCQAITDAINGDTNATVTAIAGETSVTLTAKTRGAEGNSYGLSISEEPPSQDDISVSGTHMVDGGASTTDPEEQCKAVLDFPNSDTDPRVLAGEEYADFAELFDTIDVFRSIDLGSSTAGQMGAILYLEKTIAMPTEEDWDELKVTIGTIMDEALVFQTMYDPEKDTVTSPPQAGTIGRYQRITFMADGVDTLHSSMEHTSAEYFSTYNHRFGSVDEGEPLRYFVAADSLFILAPSAIVHCFKSMQGRPLQFTVLHMQRGLAGKGAAHVVGNSILMLTGMGLVILNASDGSMGQISTLDRLFAGDWVSCLSKIESCYDSVLNASFFLNPEPSIGEMAVVWHSTQLVNMLEGANFVSASMGLDIATAKAVRAYFITKTGLIVSPAITTSGSGTMWGFANYPITPNGIATTAGESLVASAATFHADMVGALCYMTSGANAGKYREILTVNPTTKTLTFTSKFGSTIAVGDRFAISPVPFKARLWPLQDAETRKFQRWIMTGIALKVSGWSSTANNPNDVWRVGAYRNGSATLVSNTVEIDVTENPQDSAGVLSVDGIDVEPYIEQIAAGVDFELTEVEISVTMTDSRKVG